jgi:hypothetical protein
MATIDEFVLKNIGIWWRYGINRHCDEWKYVIIGRIFESEIILIPPSLKISESISNGSYCNTDGVWWRYGISRSCDEWYYTIPIVWRHGQDKSENGLCLLSPPHWRVLKNVDPHYLVLQATSITKFYLTVYYF